MQVRFAAIQAAASANDVARLTTLRALDAVNTTSSRQTIVASFKLKKCCHAALGDERPKLRSAFRQTNVVLEALSWVNLRA